MNEEYKCKFCEKSFKPNKKVQQFCSNDCFPLSIRKKMVNTFCDWCGTSICINELHYKKHKAHYCCKQHKGFSNAVRLGANIKYIKDEVQTVEWNDGIAYIIGLIATDGTLRKNRKQIKLTSSNEQFLKHISEIIVSITGRSLEIIHDVVKFKGKEYSSYSFQFTSYPFYDFCLEIGLMPNKTYIISSLRIPDEYFSSFLRGVIDGDGNFNTGNKTELLKIANIRIYSGSADFLEWINETCRKVFNINGGSILHSKNELGSKYILSFTRVYDNLLMLESIYKDAKYFYEKRYKQASYTMGNLSKLKEKYLYTYQNGTSVKCKNPSCRLTFIPKDYRHKYCSKKCREDYNRIKTHK